MPDADAEDREWVRATLAGDGDAFRRLIERHGEAVQRQLFHFARNAEEREELAQEVFCEAFFSLGTFRGDAPFRHWLARIVTLTGYAHWRARARTDRHVPLEALGNLPAGEPADAATAAADLLFALFAQLDGQDRLLMTLVYLERCGQAEIARRLGMSRVAVAVRVHRAKKRLRALGERSPWKERLSCALP